MGHPVGMLIKAWHRNLARGPALFSKYYIEVISLISRNVLPVALAIRVRNSICGHQIEWPHTEFSARAVELGNGTTVLLRPHIGEFDEGALFFRKLEYEASVFRWLSENAPDQYDTVIEVGANVGVYTCFFDSLIRAEPHMRLKQVFAFEPSQEAFRRLMANLAANNAQSIRPFNCALGDSMGFITFFEPPGHLTNGSFIRDFAAGFSQDVQSHSVICLEAAELGKLLQGTEKALIKIDVEGYEPQLLGAMREIIDRYEPDLLIEVLPDTVDAINSIAFLQSYYRFLITDAGLLQHPKVHADTVNRDWVFIRAKQGMTR